MSGDKEALVIHANEIKSWLWQGIEPESEADVVNAGFSCLVLCWGEKASGWFRFSDGHIRYAIAKPQVIRAPMFDDNRTLPEGDARTAMDTASLLAKMYRLADGRPVAKAILVTCGHPSPEAWLSVQPSVRRLFASRSRVKTLRHNDHEEQSLDCATVSQDD
jgi:hypothetical protein